jgi:hypothetical protein
MFAAARAGRYLLLALGLVAAGCGDGNNPTSPSGGTGPLVFTAELFAGNEVPLVTNFESVAHGAVDITMNVTRDSSDKITAATARFDIQLAGLAPDTTFVGAHIHPGVAGVAGPVIVNTTLSSGTPQAVQSGAATWAFDNINVPVAIAQGMIDNPSAFYFNVHSFSNPAGVARGQLQRAR